MKTHRKASCLLGLFALFVSVLLSSCTPPMRVNPASLPIPATGQGTRVSDGLDMFAYALDTPAISQSVFGTDIQAAGILPVQVVIRNNSADSVQVRGGQVFGVTDAGVFVPPLPLEMAAQQVRASTIGTTAATQAVFGAFIGAALGAAVGAAVGGAAGNAGAGAAWGAGIGGGLGAAQGLGAGLSDRWTIAFFRQLAMVALTDRVVFPGDINQGLVYLPWGAYPSLRLVVWNATRNEAREMRLPVFSAQ